MQRLFNLIETLKYTGTDDECKPININLRVAINIVHLLVLNCLIVLERKQPEKA